MSSILEALKKLEAEKNAQLAPVEEPEPVYDVDYTGGALLGNVSYASPRSSRLAPLTLVLAGGIFTMLLIGISVLLAVLLIERSQPASVALGDPASAPLAVALAPPPESLEEAVVSEFEAEPETESPETSPQVAEPEPAPAPKPAPRRAEVVTPVSLPVEVRYEPYVPEPAGGSTASSKSAPLPSDIRDLPMLSRAEREQYRLEGLSLNMLNEANALRPTANAIINLEKIFVGETLPGSNAKLIEVKSHGIAIEIQSTRQRYYIPSR